MDAFLRPLISCLLYTTILRQKKKDFGEIETSEKIQWVAKVERQLEIWLKKSFISGCDDFN